MHIQLTGIPRSGRLADSVFAATRDPNRRSPSEHAIYVRFLALYCVALLYTFLVFFYRVCCTQTNSMLRSI